MSLALYLISPQLLQSFRSLSYGRKRIEDDLLTHLISMREMFVRGYHQRGIWNPMTARYCAGASTGASPSRCHFKQPLTNHDRIPDSSSFSLVRKLLRKFCRKVCVIRA